jgi:hypothetical protein
MLTVYAAGVVRPAVVTCAVMARPHVYYFAAVDWSWVVARACVGRVDTIECAGITVTMLMYRQQCVGVNSRNEVAIVERRGGSGGERLVGEGIGWIVVILNGASAATAMRARRASYHAGVTVASVLAITCSKDVSLKLLLGLSHSNNVQQYHTDIVSVVMRIDLRGI